MRGYLVGSEAASPEAIAITGEIDDLFDNVRGAHEYVAQEFDVETQLPNSSGLGARTWTYDELSLEIFDGETLAIRRRWIQAKGIGRLVMQNQSHYDIYHHTHPVATYTDLYKDDFTTWAINPAKGMTVERGGPGERRKTFYGAASPSFRDQSKIIRDILKRAQNPVHRVTRKPFRPLD